MMFQEETDVSASIGMLQSGRNKAHTFQTYLGKQLAL